VNDRVKIISGGREFQILETRSVKCKSLTMAVNGYVRRA
jgi:hypothetical protein